VTVLYFAWVKEKVGVSEERVDPPAEVATVADLMAWLARRSEGHASAFTERRMIKAAVDQTHVDVASPIAGAQEVAFFPPVTGG
jgi:molybdopterin synthase sulfur carrier subunit